MSVEVLLLADVPALGVAGATVKVAEGYARNYLLPKALAGPVTPATLRRLDKLRKEREELARLQLAEARDKAAKLKGLSVTIRAKTTDGQKLYGSVTAAGIVEALQAQSVELDRSQIGLEQPLHEVGQFDVPVKLHPEVSLTLKVWIVEEQFRMPRETASIEAPLRVPPHSAEAERGVLGSILLDASRVMDLCIEAGLDEDAFHLHAHRVVFSIFQSMSTGNTPIDMLTTIQRLRSVDRLKEIGGAEFLEKLVDATPTAAHAEYYIDLVRQKHLLRRTIACARRVEQACYEEGQSADEILGASEQRFLDLTEHQKGGGQSWPEAIKTTFARIERIMEGGVSGISTGFLNLDHKLRGLRSGEMLVLAARPSMGKTSLAMNICECLALGRDLNGQPLKGGSEAHGGKCPVAIFSLEMSQEALAMRMLCAHAGISGYQLEGGYLNSQQVNRHFLKAASELNQASLYVDDTGGLDVMELRARARRLKKQYGIGLIMVDYLQLLNCREYARQGRQLETSAISGHLKSMAKELNLPVLVLSQLSRAPEQRVGDRTGTPRLSDLRDSGAIEQDADVVLLLRRPCKYKGDKEYDDKTLAIVDVAKHRNGPTGEVRLNFDEHFTRFSDRAETAGGEGDMAVPDDGAEAAGLEP